ncbi:hypothetical protein C8F01DRAFT_1325645 [Mycena amicta]|nr:hypothetical protein C8F01DRAFT_1325645 [Mycena amicta]
MLPLSRPHRAHRTTVKSHATTRVPPQPEHGVSATLALATVINDLPQPKRTRIPIDSPPSRLPPPSPAALPHTLRLSHQEFHSLSQACVRGCRDSRSTSSFESNTSGTATQALSRLCNSVTLSRCINLKTSPSRNLKLQRVGDSFSMLLAPLFDSRGFQTNGHGMNNGEDDEGPARTRTEGKTMDMDGLDAPEAAGGGASGVSSCIQCNDQCEGVVEHTAPF